MYEPIQDRILETVDDITIIQTPPCPICGEWGMIAIRSSAAAALLRGAPIQEAAPELPRPIREQRISGTHPDCWPF